MSTQHTTNHAADALRKFNQSKANKPKLVAFLAALGLAFSAQADEWLSEDKKMHIGATVMLSKSIQAITGNMSLAFWSATAVGLAKELQDQHKPGRKFSSKDMAANLAGALIGSSIAPNLMVRIENRMVYFSWSY